MSTSLFNKVLVKAKVGVSLSEKGVSLASKGVSQVLDLYLSRTFVGLALTPSNPQLTPERTLRPDMPNTSNPPFARPDAHAQGQL